MSYNRIANSTNPYQGKFKKVLCLCSAGLLRSPTIAVVLSQEPYNFNTRAAGMSTEFALIPVDEVLLNWADEIVCADYNQFNQLELMQLTTGKKLDKPIYNLNIPDSYAYRDSELVRLVKERYEAETGTSESVVRNSSGQLAKPSNESLQAEQLPES